LGKGQKVVLEDLENLINLRITWEERLSGAHLCKDTTNRPHVNTSGVLATTKQDLWGSIPQGDDLVSICAKGYTKGTRKTEISKLEIAFTINEKVLRLEITVKDAVTVAVSDSFAQLAHELLDHRVTQAKSSKIRTRAFRKCLASTTITNRKSLHVFLQIEVEELEDQV
jgi:hypothetical protein